MTAPTTTQTAAPAAEQEALVHQARRARSQARKIVPLLAAMAVLTGTIALNGGVLAADDGTRWSAAVTFVIATVGFTFAVRAAAPLPTAEPASEMEHIDES